MTARSAMTRVVELSDKSPVLSGGTDCSSLGTLASGALATGLARTWLGLGRRPLAVAR